MTRKLKLLTVVIIFLTYLSSKCCECATRKRGPPARKHPNLSPNEIDPNVSPILSHSNLVVTTAIPTSPTGSVTELINTVNVQQQAPISSSNVANVIADNANINNLDITTIESIELNANNTVLDPVEGLTSSSTQSSLISSSTPTNVDDPNPINKFCKCSNTLCDCCRDFSLPLVPVRGPGCARIHYLGNERMSVQIKYGDIVLAQRTINGKKAPPVCVGLPGGYTSFCARIYGLSKEKSGFKSCLSLELRAEEELEAQLRVSCFRFNDKGLSVTEAEPVPQIDAEKEDEDDDDIFGLGGGDEEDEEDAGDDYEDEDDDDDDDDDDAPSNDDGDYDFRFFTDVFGSSEKKTKTKSKITIVPNTVLTSPEFKDASDNTAAELIQTKTADAADTNSKVKKHSKSKKKINKKKKNNDDEYENPTNCSRDSAMAEYIDHMIQHARMLSGSERIK